MTKHADPPPNAITYCQWLARQVEAGGVMLCGPPVADWPTLWDRLFPGGRPNRAAEARLEARLHELEAEAGR